MLRVLELAETGATDEVLLGIASHCTHLRHLNISSCQVTDIGVAPWVRDVLLSRTYC